MVYCDLKRNDNGLLTYSYGGSHDRSGIVIFDVRNGSFEIVRKSDSLVFLRHLDSLARRARGLYEKGVVKEKLAYEIG